MKKLTINKIDLRIYYILIIIFTLVICLNIYQNFNYSVKLRELKSLIIEQDDIIDYNLRLISIIYELEDEERIEKLSKEYLNLEKKSDKDISVIQYE